VNFTGRTEGSEVQLELKYCERCGGLGLRPRGGQGLYCTACRIYLATLPNSGEATRSGKRRRKARVHHGTARWVNTSRTSRVDLEAVATVEESA
jgi:hypothetical protein